MNIREIKEFGDYILTFNTFDDFSFRGGKKYEVVFEKRYEVNGFKYIKLINSWHYKSFKVARKRFNRLREKVA